MPKPKTQSKHVTLAYDDPREVVFVVDLAARIGIDSSVARKKVIESGLPTYRRCRPGSRSQLLLALMKPDAEKFLQIRRERGLPIAEQDVAVANTPTSHQFAEVIYVSFGNNKLA